MPAKTAKKPWKTNHPIEYRAWSHMKGRCYQPNDRAYRYYGARGIKVCDEWLNSFEQFYCDMGDRPEGASLDRIDVDGDYSPSNCRWADGVTQNRNKRIPTNNTSSAKGVNYFSPRGTWQARIGVGGARKLIGYFKTKEEAIKARLLAEQEYGYDS